MTFEAEQWTPKSRRFFRQLNSTLSQVLGSLLQAIVWLLVTLGGR
jgi:hypothetical protein